MHLEECSVRPFWRAAREGLVIMGKVMRLGGLGTLVVAIVGALALSGGPALALPTPGHTPAPVVRSRRGTTPASRSRASARSGRCRDQRPRQRERRCQRRARRASAPSTITVGGNVIRVSGSVLGLGCLPGPAGHPTLDILAASTHSKLRHHYRREHYRHRRQRRSAERNHGQGERHADWGRRPPR